MKGESSLWNGKVRLRRFLNQSVRPGWIVLNLLLFTTVSAQDWSFTPHAVQGKVHMLEPANTFGNVGVFAGDDGVLIIDSHFQPAVGELLNQVAKISTAEVRFLVNTHVHPDHIGGNGLLADYGVTVVAHNSVRLAMLSELRIPRRGGTFRPRPEANALPVLTYTDAISFHFNDEEVRIFHAPPAHTGGDSFIHFTGSDVLHLGDVFRTRRYPIVDEFNGGSFLGMIEAMELAISLAGPNTKVIPGHGSGFSDRAGMEEYHQLLLTLKERVQLAIEQEQPLSKLLAAGLTHDLDVYWGDDAGWTAADLLPVIYGELSQ
ncbi:MAG: MBL fold metallo-hydrolase [Gammaproteobacteria bacterium]|nr:MBL fold metallo-hydrolase [Gammaproteobacteria bacterium]